MNPEQNQAPWSHTSLYTWSNEEVQKVVNTYLVLHRVFFGLWIHIIILAISIFIIRNSSSVSASLPFPIRNNELKIQERQIKEELSAIESRSYKENDVRVIIKQWPLSITSWYLDTTNNLVVYKWYVTPKTITLPITNELKTITYFNNSWYDIRFLDMYLNSFVLNPNRNPNAINKETILLPLQTSLVQQFNLWCLFGAKLTDTFCQKAFDEIMLWESPIFALYDLKQDYPWLIDLSESIQNTTYSLPFCDAMKKYIFFSNDVGKEIKDIMVSCGKQYENSAADFISFRSIQEQLSREAIWPTVTSSRLLNIYKLISTQNDIYYDIIVGKDINTNRINWYNSYVESLLKTPDSLQWFYFDVIARYNNTFLIPELTKASIQNRWEKAEEYKKIIEYMKKLNQWDSIARHEGLVKYIIKKDLLESVNMTVNSWANNIDILTLFQENYSFQNFVIKTSSGSNNSISADWLLRFDSVWLANNSPMSVKFIYENSKFFVQSILLPRHTEIATVINKILWAQKLAIWEVYNLIIENSKLKETQDVCSVFKWDKTMTSCTSTKAVFNKQGIIYTFEYTIVDGVSNYTINNDTLYKTIVWIYGKKITITKNPVDAIKLILNYTIEKEEEVIAPTDPIWWAKEIQIQKDFNLIEAKISDISTSNNNSIVKFLLKDREYIAVYDSSKKTIIWLWVIIGSKAQAIRNFTFSFATAKPEEIELFKTDPASFLLQKDPLTVKKLGLK